MNAAVHAPGKVWTEEELQALPSDNFSYELIDDELVMSPKNDSFHSRICMRLCLALDSFVIAGRLGVTFGAEMGFWMKNRNCRAPDVSFVSRTRLIEIGFSPTARKFFPGAPDLAAEVLSPSNTRREMDAKLRDFFDSGTRLAWLIDPDARRVEVCRSPIQRTLVGSGGFLDGEDVLPGFRYPIANLFKEWDWD
jgi:Uma2 family endonuclease